MSLTRLAVALLLLPTPALAAAPARPNVLVILADDLGYSDLGCYGGEVETPNLDALAARGLRFTQFYNTARCWPSRAALLSGYYAQQVNRDPAGQRPRWGALLPELLKPAGYKSYHSGKWHVDGPVLGGGFERSYLVVDQDRFFSPRNHALDDQRLPQPTRDEGYYATTAITDHALRWLKEHDEGDEEAPFFLYLAYTCPHFPLHAPAEDVARCRGRYDDGWDELRRRRHERMRAAGIVNCELSDRTEGVPAWESLSADDHRAWASRMEVHAAMVERMDREIGRVIDRLREAGRLEETLILFCSDNGASAEAILRGDGHDPRAVPGSAGSYLCLEPGWANLANTPLRKSKIFVHEGGISTPLIVHWPAGVAGQGELRHAPAHLIDIVPTLLELAGAEAPKEWNGEVRPSLPGKSLVPLLSTDAKLERDCLFFSHQGNRALRAGKWKIVASGNDAKWELYDLTNDRSESHDLAATQPETVRQLSAMWEERDKRYGEQGANAPETEGRGRRRGVGR